MRVDCSQGLYVVHIAAEMAPVAKVCSAKTHLRTCVDFQLLSFLISFMLILIGGRFGGCCGRSW